MEIPSYVLDELLSYKEFIEDGLITEEELTNALIAGFEKKKKAFDDEMIQQASLCQNADELQEQYEHYESYYESIRKYEISQLLLPKTMELLRTRIDSMDEDETVPIPAEFMDELDDFLGREWDELQESLTVGDKERSEQWYKIGTMYENGEGTVKDDNQAIEHYRMAAELGHIEAQNRLDEMLKK